MELRNEIFAYVYDWLRKNRYIDGQKDLAAKTGINKNTITNILNGITTVSDKTLLKLNSGFDYMFNMQYLRGLDSSHMLVIDIDKESFDNIVPYISNKNKVQPKTEQPPTLEITTEELLQLAAQGVKENEELRRELKATIQEFHKERQEYIHEMQHLINELKSMRRSRLYENPNLTTMTVSEQEEKFNQ